MKRLLYAGAGLSIFALIYYFSAETIANNQLAAYQKELPQQDTFPYIKYEYIYSFPKGISQDAYNSYTKNLKSKGYKLKKRCNCSEGYELWDTSIDVNAQPDKDEPPPPSLMIKRKPNDTSPTIERDTSRETRVRISKNFKIVMPVSFEKVHKRLPPIDIPISTNSNKVLVAVVDTGVDTLNPFIKNYLHRTTGSPSLCIPPFIPNTISSSYNEGIFGLNKVIPSTTGNEPLDSDGLWLKRWCIGVYKEGHGTLINGIIAGQGYYPTKPEGITEAINLDILNVKIMEKRTEEPNLFDALCGIHYALDKGAKVINASWIVKPSDSENLRIRAMFDLTLSRIKDNKAILVTCAGNNGVKNVAGFQVWPATYSADPIFKDYVITVGSLDMQTMLPTVSSNEGDFVTVFAPGSGIQMRRPSSSAGVWICFDVPQSGSSYATAFITRDIAKLIATGTLITNVKSSFVSSTSSVGGKRYYNPPSTM